MWGSHNSGQQAQAGMPFTAERNNEACLVVVVTLMVSLFLMDCILQTIFISFQARKGRL
jgi:hypothetical protein